jgi:hypothetical protein
MLNDSTVRDNHRKRWLETATENPNASRATLAQKKSASYHWLVKYDKRWLEENSPERCRNRSRKSRIDWSERDKNYSVAVRETATKMLTATGYPVRASRTAIKKKLGILAVVCKNPTKFQLTNSTLDEVSESVTAFVIRRILWAFDCYRQEQISAAQWEIQIRASVSTTIGREPQVKAALDECARKLHGECEAGWKD